MPCATQNEISGDLAEILVKNGVQIVAEGANMPATVEAVTVFHDAGVWYCPGKAANAGGVAVSALEMSQNSQRLTWESEQVDQQLDEIMQTIYETCRQTAAEYDEEKIYYLVRTLPVLQRLRKQCLHKDWSKCEIFL